MSNMEVPTDTNTDNAEISVVNEKNIEKMDTSNVKSAQKSNFLGEGPLIKTMWIITYPDLIEKFTEAFYSLIDTMIIGNMAGNTEAERSESLAAISFSLPLIQGLVFGVCLFFSIGSGALYARSLGKGSISEAESVIWNMFLLCLIAGIVCPCLYGGLSYYLILFLGATPDTQIFHDAQLYFVIITACMIFHLFSLGCTSLIQGEGSALYSAIILICGFIITLLGDLLFIGVFHLNMTGAAIASVLGYAVSGILGFTYFFTKKASIRVNFKSAHISWKLMKPVMNIGISGLCSAFSTAILNSVTNRFILKYSPYDESDPMTVAAIAAAGAIGRVNYFCFLPMLSICQSMMPILSFCKGANLYKRHMACMKNAFIASLSLALILTILGYFLAPYVGIAMGGSSEFLSVFVPAMRYTTSSLCFSSLPLIMYPTLQSNGYGLMAGILIACKQCIFYIAFQVLFCELFHNFWGCFVAYPVADFCSTIFALILFFIYRKKLGGGYSTSADQLSK